MSQKIAFVFPGQGAQSVGMLNALASDESSKPLLSEAGALAQDALGQNIVSLIQEGPASELDLTVNTQPAMLLADVLTYQAWLKAGGVRPSIVAGHSLGEYAAVVASGGLTLEAGLKLVRIRAQAMQSAVPVGEGGMAAVIGLCDRDVVQLCKQVTAEGNLIEAVNFNAPSQVVVAGTTAGVSALCALAKEKGAKRALPLAVSAPFHSSLLHSASEALAKAFANEPVSDLDIPLVANVDVSLLTAGRDMEDALIRQACNPVRWVESVERMVSEGVDLFVECGPGKILAGLIKRISDVPVININSPESIAQAIQTLSKA